MQSKKVLEPLVPFPVDAESDHFTAALASALIVTQGYTGETPHWCAPNQRDCIHCKPCGDHLLERHQVSLYHCLLTASTLAFGFDYPWDDTVAPIPCRDFRKAGAGMTVLSMHSPGLQGFPTSALAAPAHRRKCSPQ